MAIVLDNRVMSVATIQGRITDSGQITGINRDEMVDTVITLKSGALPASMDYLEERTIGPSLGAESIRAGFMASLAGLVLVVLFMLVLLQADRRERGDLDRRQPGDPARADGVPRRVMTLPGIAGFILTIGMGVDSNVLIFERIKEELATARGVRAAVNAGFDRVWWTIVDTHVSSLIAAAVPAAVRHQPDSRLRDRR